MPIFARVSSTCVAQITGVWDARHSSTHESSSCPAVSGLRVRPVFALSIGTGIKGDEMATLRATATGIAVLTLWSAAARGFAPATAGSEDAIRQLQGAVDAYVALRARATQGLPPLEISPYPEDFLMASEAMAAAIRAARPSAAEGDIINAEAAGVLRRRVRAMLAEPDCPVAGILAAERDDDQPLPPRPIVHDRFDWSGGSFMPACVLRALPPLPDELQFRFVQRDLALVDIGADLIVDVVPDALAPGESWQGVRYAGSPRFAGTSSREIASRGDPVARTGSPSSV
jgi:hypothetical protein